jgi:hypothetical protein
MISLASSLDFRLTYPADCALTRTMTECRFEVHRIMRRYPYQNAEAWPGDQRVVAIVMIDRRRTLISERVAEVLEGAFR